MEFSDEFPTSPKTFEPLKLEREIYFSLLFAPYAARTQLPGLQGSQESVSIHPASSLPLQSLSQTLIWMLCKMFQETCKKYLNSSGDTWHNPRCYSGYYSLATLGLSGIQSVCFKHSLLPIWVNKIPYCINVYNL